MHWLLQTESLHLMNIMYIYMFDWISPLNDKYNFILWGSLAHCTTDNLRRKLIKPLQSPTWCRISSCPKYRGGVGLLSKDRGGIGIGSKGWGLGRRGCERRSKRWAEWRSLIGPKSTRGGRAECKRWGSCRWSCWWQRNNRRYQYRDRFSCCHSSLKQT